VSKECIDPCEAFSISFTNPAAICDTATFDLTTLVPAAAAAGEWTNTDGVAVTVVGPGTYSYSVTTNEGCSASADVTIIGEDCNDPCEGVSISIANPEAICSDSTLNLTDIIPAELAGGSWTDIDGNEVSVVSPGIYTYTLMNGIGCTASATVSIEGMDCNTDPCVDHMPTLDLGADVTICSDDAPYVYTPSLSTNCAETIEYSTSDGAQFDVDGETLTVSSSGTINAVVTGPNGNAVEDVIVITIEVCNNGACTPSSVEGMYVGGTNCSDDDLSGPTSLTVTEAGTFQIALEDQDGDSFEVGLDGCEYQIPSSSVEVLGVTFSSEGDGYFSGDTLFLNSLIISDGDTATCNFVGIRGGVVATPCDDGNSNTENDVQIDDCNCCGTPIAGQVIYVDGEATGVADGTSWADAYTDLQEAMQTAQAGQEIWLADGVYLPTQDGDRDVYFNLPSGVDLYGGFNGSEMNICQRDFKETRSVLSGDLLQDDKVDVVNIVPLELLFTGTEENSHYVLRNSQVTDDIKIDGIAISGGVADGSNTAGGGGFLFVNDNDATLEMNNVLVVHNQGAGLGGAGRINTRSATTFTVKMNRVVFLQNQVSGPGLSKGGGLYAAGFDGGLVDLDVSNCIFAQNFSENRGGAVNTDDNVRSNYTNTIFAGNKASDGGAIFENGGGNEVLHTNNTFYINFAEETGGAIVNFTDFSANTIDLRNSIFFGNATTLTAGPGLHNFGSASNNFSIQNNLFNEPDLATLETLAVGMDDRGGNQFGGDPQFVDPANADFSLQSTSTAIDAGEGSFVTLMDDLLGKVRVQGDVVDLGANEFGDELTCNFDRFDFDLAYIPPVYDEIEFVTEEAELEAREVADVKVTTFPNPASDVINVAVSKLRVEDEVSLKLYDMSGKVLPIDYSMNSNAGLTVEYNIPVKDFRGGVYFLKTKVGRFTINKRVIVIK